MYIKAWDVIWERELVYSMNETFLAVFEALYFCCLMTCHDMTYII